MIISLQSVVDGEVVTDHEETVADWPPKTRVIIWDGKTYLNFKNSQDLKSIIFREVPKLELPAA